MIGEHLDLHEHTRARLIREAIARAEADAQSCVVRHAQVEQTHRAFWRAVEQRQRPVTRLRRVR